MKHFPNSYPYLNKHGVEFTKKQVEDLAREILTYHRKKTLDFGLELSYIILWAMETAENHEAFKGISIDLGAKAAYRAYYMARKHIETFEIVDDAMMDKTFGTSIEALNMRIDAARALGDTTLEDLDSMSKVARFRAISKARLELAEGGH